MFADKQSGKFGVKHLQEGSRRPSKDVDNDDSKVIRHFFFLSFLHCCSLFIFLIPPSPPLKQVIVTVTPPIFKTLRSEVAAAGAVLLKEDKLLRVREVFPLSLSLFFHVPTLSLSLLFSRLRFNW